MQRSADALTRLAMSHDASRFLQIPEEVVVASSTQDVVRLFREATSRRRHLTFRGAGTSLSGQGVTDGMLVDVRRRFREIEVLDGGRRVRAGAGATVTQVNAKLRPYGRRLGPDPASAQSATIGGVVANNSTGKTSGISGDAFHTIESCVVVLPNGRILDTGDPHADLVLTWDEPALSGGLATLRHRLRDDHRSLEQVSRLWGLRNSMGYHLRALTDFARPSDIVRQLMVGSEGTLGFIAEATFRTVRLKPHKHLELAMFPSLTDAVEASSHLLEHGFDVVELFDEDAIRLIRDLPRSHQAFDEFEIDGHAALLLELHAETPEQLAERLVLAQESLDELPEHYTIQPDDTRPAQWRVHHGLLTAMAQHRTQGTSVLMEDLSVPRERIVDVVDGLNALFDRYKYPRSAITGHLSDSTLHFVLTENFEDPATVRRFKRFVQAFTRLILKHDGVLRAQHGTGRAMTPFLEQQVGPELFDVMREIKHLFDPAGILSPAVMFDEDPDVHVNALKLLPKIEDSVTQCIECGLCEQVCSSSDLTLSPRQRIVLRREIVARAQDRELIRALRDNYRYAAIDTCSTSSICASACPLGIDTGELVREQRAAEASEREEQAWAKAAERWGAATRLGSVAMTAADRLKPVARFVTRYGRRQWAGDQVWRYDDDLPRGSNVRRRPTKGRPAKDPVAAYFPGCQQTFMASHQQGVLAAFNEVSTRAGVPVSLLNASDLCCGMPWKMRGLHDGLETMTRKVRRSLTSVPASTIVIDASSCVDGLQEMLAGMPADVVDIVKFTAESLLPTLTIKKKFSSLLLYPTCATVKSRDLESLLKIGEAIAEEVVVPAMWNCCGAHGDSGLRHPEVPAAAVALSLEDIRGRQFEAYASSTRSCEVALSKVTEKPFVHILELLAAATR